LFWKRFVKFSCHFSLPVCYKIENAVEFPKEKNIRTEFTEKEIERAGYTVRSQRSK